MKNTKSKLLKENAEPPGSAFEQRVLKFLDRIFKLNLKYGRHPSRSTEFTCNKEMSALVSYLHDNKKFTGSIQDKLVEYEDQVARYGEDGKEFRLIELNEIKAKILKELEIRE